MPAKDIGAHNEVCEDDILHETQQETDFFDKNNDNFVDENDVTNKSSTSNENEPATKLTKTISCICSHIPSGNT